MAGKNRINNTDKGGRSSEKRVFTGYLIIILLVTAGSFFNGLHLWGINWWLYLSLTAKITLLLITAVSGLLVILYPTRIGIQLSASSDVEEPAEKIPVLFYIIVTFLFLIAFVVGRTETHFLGDGYELLSRLSNNIDPVKQWDVGATYIQKILYEFVGGNGIVDALFSYRITAVSSGLIIILVTFLSAQRLFDDNVRRLFFTWGVLSAGYMLLFFGYVENYALLMSFVVICTLLGVLSSLKKFTSVYLIPIVILAVFFHIFGLLLTPGLSYLLFSDLALGKKLKHVRTRTKILIYSTILVIGILCYIIIRQSDYFFTFVLLPIIPDQFTVDNDWLFSKKHFAGLFNLLILLFPGIAIFIFQLRWAELSSFLKSRVGTFLFIQCIVALLTVFVLNPGIGMPRNWDLFSIVGVPIAIFIFIYLLRGKVLRRTQITSVVLILVVNTIILGSRVYVFASPRQSIRHFKDYLELDKARSRNAWHLLVEYYEQKCDSITALATIHERDKRYPEKLLNDNALSLITQGKARQAIPMLERAIAINPVYWSAYVNLSLGHLQLRQIDTALVLLDIANGLNPNNAQILDNMGSALYLKGESNKAKELLLRAIDIDSTQTNALAGVATIYLSEGDVSHSMQYLEKHFSIAKSDYLIYLNFGDQYLDSQQYKAARRAYQMALEKGMDSSYYYERCRVHPLLSE